MKSTNLNFTFRDLLPTEQQIELAMGYMPGEVPEPVSIALNDLLSEVVQFTDVRSEYRIINDIRADPVEKSILVADARFNIKKVIFNQVKNAESVALFIATAGKTIDEFSKTMWKSGDTLKGYISDVIGSMVVEAAADSMHMQIRDMTSADGKNISNRFSPGYCGWNVCEQHTMFQFFKENYCGITLSESALMSPVKSVSGFIGIGRNVRFSHYPCNSCNEKDCIHHNRVIL